MKLLYSSHTQKGSAKRTNLDTVFVDAPLGMFLIVDAVYEKDEPTPQLERSAQTVQEFLKGYAGEKDPQKCVELVDAAFQQLNSRLLKENRDAGRSKSVMLSMDALWIRGDHVINAHIGHTRSYLWRQARLYRLTEDHLYGAEMVKQGILKPEEASKSPMSNVLTRCLGQNDLVKIDIQPLEIGADDLFLLTTNGISRGLSLDDISRFIEESSKHFDIEECAETLVSLAHRNDAKDNATSLLVRTFENKVYSAQAIQPEEKLKLLGQVFLFRHLSYTEANQVLNVCKLIQLKSGEVLCKEGDPGDEMYIVASGKAAISRGGRNIATTSVGETVGEVGLIDKQPRTATVKAETDMWLLSMSREAFLRLVNKDHLMGNKMLWAMLVDLNQKFRSNTRQQSGASNPPPPQKPGTTGTFGGFKR